jgi:hypothetical protein
LHNPTSGDTATLESPVEKKKVCHNCGKNVSGHRRVKDSRGYLCYACAKAERQAEREGKVRCKECRKLVKPEGLVAFHGKMICRKCFGDHQETARFKKKVSTEGYEAHEKRNLLILAGLFVLLGVIVAYSWFFKMRPGHGGGNPTPAAPVHASGAAQTTNVKSDAGAGGTNGASDGALNGASSGTGGAAPTNAGK